MNNPHVQEIIKVIQAFGHEVANSGLPAEEIRKAEEALQVKFPEVLVDFYLQLGNHPVYKNRGCYEYNIRSLSSLYPADEDGYLTLFSEGGGYDSVWECVRVEELGKAEPIAEFWVVDSVYDRHPLLEGLQNVTFANLTAPHHLKKAHYANVTQVANFTAGLPEVIPGELFITPELYVQTDQVAETDKFNVIVGASTPQTLLSFITHSSRQKHQTLLHNLWLNIEPEDAFEVELLGQFSEQQLEKLYYNSRQVSVKELRELLDKENKAT
ncbi:SMI1/KNR4 family protein [Microscilla marina]|uniref:Knr4/Smi1-like domain-containing protein n=1 Tax=Microscilla marina ATCC 23134 TaxID=313606 RepID=A1ZBZ5_MICM2|nr:SMI1/KNR4 family protein [Microscilla marina]EAY31797.1 hypothetical protein M23134_01826 [Microscilla marina ATCC 23134]